jgi:hypothetical protein
MGIINAITAQFKPSPSNIESTGTSPPTQPRETHEAQDEKHEQEVDVELQKSEAVYRPDIDPGVARVEAIQAVWGKKGKYIIIAGLAMVMIM